MASWDGMVSKTLTKKLVGICVRIETNKPLLSIGEMSKLAVTWPSLMTTK